MNTPVVPDLVKENRDLRRAVEELSILNDLARTISVHLDSDQIMRSIIHGSVRTIGAEQGVITLADLEEGAEDGNPRTLVRAIVSSSQNRLFHLHDSLLGWIYVHRRPLVVSDHPKSRDRFRRVKWDPSIRSLLSVPLQSKAKIVGVLTLYNKRGETGFSEDDQRLLSIIASQSAQVIENAKLHEQEKAYLRIREQIRVASEVQVGLLPKREPRIPGYEVVGKSVPAEMVGGDYFDFIKLNEHQFTLCLGDVTGKGLPAALLMANLQATVRSQCSAEPSPKTCLSRANRLLFESTDAAKFVTFFYGILDTQSHRLCFANAGHNPPFLSTSLGLKRLTSGGMVLGVFADSSYTEECVDLEPGDSLLIYSDGITEATNSEEIEFGEKRLLELVKQHSKSSALSLLQAVFAAVEEFSEGTEQTDDMALVVLRREDS